MSILDRSSGSISIFIFLKIKIDLVLAWIKTVKHARLVIHLREAIRGLQVNLFR